MQHNKITSLKNSSIHIMIPGQVGLLEGKLTLSKNKNAPIALIAPPHPKFNGTMNNKIVNLLYKQFEKFNWNTLKLNYRGVGQSQGESIGGESEITDALTALDWLVHKCDKSKTLNPQICVAGFSFGGWVSLQCAMRRPEITKFISITTPFESYPINMLTPCPNGLIINATDDHMISIDNATEFCSRLIVQKNCKLNIKTINSDHYLTDKTAEVEAMIEEYLKK